MAANLAAKPVPFAGQTGNFKLYTGRCIITGGTFTNSGGAASKLNIYDGQDVTGAPVAFTSVGAGGQQNLQLPQNGVLCEIGAYISIATGTITGSLFLVFLDVHFGRTPPGE